MIKTIATLASKDASKLNLNSRFLSKFCQGSEAPKYNIRLAYPPDYKKVHEFMMNTFMKTEPSLVNIGGGLAECPEPVMVKCLLDDIKGGLTLLCEDFKTKEIAGVSVNHHSRYSDIEGSRSIAQCCQNPAARDLINFFAHCSQEGDPWNNYCISDLLECQSVAVSPNHMRQGIAKRLVEESWILARDLDFRLFRIDATSSFGWECLWSTPYRRYRNEAGEFVFKNIQEPHTIYEIYVDDLSYVGGYRPKPVDEGKKK